MDYCYALEREQQEFLEKHPVKGVMNLQPKQVKIVRFPALARYYAIAASFILCIGAGYVYMTSLGNPGYRIKGKTELSAYVKTDDNRIEQRTNDTFFTGERIQFRYSSGSKNRFILMSIDTTGSMVTYYPGRGDSAIALEPGQGIPLPNSIVLDEYAGKELFVGVFAEKPVAVSLVKQRVRDAFSAKGKLDSFSLAIPNAEVVLFPCMIKSKGGQ
jgi:hypothetical protein